MDSLTFAKRNRRIHILFRMTEVTSRRVKIGNNMILLENWRVRKKEAIAFHLQCSVLLELSFLYVSITFIRNEQKF